MVNAQEQATTGANAQLPHLQVDNSQPNLVIQNGFSLSKGDNLTNIPEGSIIQHSADGITRVFDSNGKQLSISNDIDSRKIPTPEGYISADKINQIPNGSFVQVNDNGTTNVYLNDKRILTVLSSSDKKTTIASSGGWVESSQSWGISQMAQFVADWTVPSSPPDPYTNAYMYIFNGIEPSNGADILQPLLEYNLAGNHVWTGQAYYVDNGIVYKGPEINTAVGHQIQGTMAWDPAALRWNLIFKDLSTGTSSSELAVSAPNIGTTNLGAFCALEAYLVTDNNDISGTTTFTNIQAENLNLNPISFSWTRQINTNMGLTNLGVLFNGMTPVTLHTNNN